MIASSIASANAPWAWRVIAAARRRQRLRRLATGLGLAVLIALVVRIATAPQPTSMPATARRAGAPAPLPLRVVLARRPYAGLRWCRHTTANCGKVAVAIWLRQPAQSLQARINGTSVSIHPGGLGGTGRTYWEGLVRLRSSALRLPADWNGSPRRHIVLTLRIRGAHGGTSGRLRLGLFPGFG